MNTNDFSKRKIGDKLWCIQIGDCEVSKLTHRKIFVVSDDRSHACFFFDGKFEFMDKFQSLYFSNPNIIAPPESPRLPDYKPGQWIAVWEEVGYVSIRRFLRFEGREVISDTATIWPNYCTLEELPEVLAKWEEQR